MTKWRCRDCGQKYGHNPSKCDICGETVFQLLPDDHNINEFEGGEETTELGADVSELVQDANPKSEVQQEEETDRVGNEEDSTTMKKDTDESLLSSLIPWL